MNDNEPKNEAPHKSDKSKQAWRVRLLATLSIFAEEFVAFCLRDANHFSVKWVSDHLKNYAIAAAAMSLGQPVVQAHSLSSEPSQYLVGTLLVFIGLSFGALNICQLIFMVSERFDAHPISETTIGQWTFVLGAILSQVVLVGLVLVLVLK